MSAMLDVKTSNNKWPNRTSDISRCNNRERRLSCLSPYPPPPLSVQPSPPPPRMSTGTGGGRVDGWPTPPAPFVTGEDQARTNWACYDRPCQTTQMAQRNAAAAAALHNQLSCLFSRRRFSLEGEGVEWEWAPDTWSPTS